MDFRKLGKSLLFPHIFILIVLLPISAGLLVYSMVTMPETHPLRISTYVLAFYVLTILCARLPQILRFFRKLKQKNRYMRRWTADPRLRMNATLLLNVLWNGAYATLQLGLGIYHRSLWFCSLGGYYLCLTVIRVFLLRHTLRHLPGENIHRELLRYRACGLVLLFMNLALSGMMLQMVRENPRMPHPEIITIAMATYTFTTLTTAIMNVVRYRKFSSPVMSASKVISLAAACVSLLTLEGTMLSSFGNMAQKTQSLFLGLSGGGISLFIILTAIYMILQSNKKIRYMENDYENK